MNSKNERSMILTVIGGASVNWMKRLMVDVYMLDCFYDDGDPSKVTSGNDNTFFF
jgi:hypothetical protein